MSTDTASNRDRNEVKPTSPIPINVSTTRRRSMSVSSTDSSPSSPPALQTPITPYSSTFMPSSTSPSSSPLLSYFMSTSPSKPNATFPYRRPSGFGAPPVFEDDEGQETADAPSSHHTRRATTAWGGNGRVSQQQASPPVNPPLAEAQRDRGVGVLRRLSLSSGFNKPFLPGLGRSTSPPRPSTPPPSAVTPTAPKGAFPSAASPETSPTPRKGVRRATTINARSTEGKQRRAPSPMGERILKGHFDGFN